MKIAVACDHGGYRLKNVLIEEMKKQEQVFIEALQGIAT